MYPLSHPYSTVTPEKYIDSFTENELKKFPLASEGGFLQPNKEIKFKNNLKYFL